MHISLGTLVQKYLLRPAHRLTHDFRIYLIIGAPLTFALGITLIVIHPRPSTAPPGMLAAQITCLLLGMVGPLLLLITQELYEANYDRGRDLKLARRLVEILTEHGTLPSKVLKQHYNRHHVMNLPLKVEHLITRDYTRHLFVYDFARETVAVPDHPTPERDVPFPDHGDYQTAYYQLYARLRAIREHPELVAVQDSLIDELYGIG